MADFTISNMTTGTVAAYGWSFGDGYTSTITDPVHVYETPGTYTGILTAAGLGGMDTLTRMGYVTVTDGQQATAPAAAGPGPGAASR